MSYRTKAQRWLASYSDLVLAVLVVGVVMLLIVRVTPAMMDYLIAANIGLAVVVLLVAIYARDAVRLPSFPTVLLLATLFRLALNVSSTRLILLDADAGQIIHSFGEFVVGGDFVVGAVIFLILTLIQFIVIAKGSERVSEVSARFTLDALPGKQMAIDNELRNGDIEKEEATRRRYELERESKLFGAMDGAMKFVKGDAIAGIVISLINIMGGLAIGMGRDGISAGEAVQLYSLLTIGDGLVSQIPALLMGMAAGLVVTRVAASQDPEGGVLASELLDQVRANPRALRVASVVLVMIGVSQPVTGFPAIPFVLLAGMLVALSVIPLGSGADDTETTKGDPDTAESAPLMADGGRALPLTIEHHHGLAKFFGVSVSNEGQPLGALPGASGYLGVVRAATEWGQEAGVPAPAFRPHMDPIRLESVEGSDDKVWRGTKYREGEYGIVIYDGVVERGLIDPDRLLVLGNAAALRAKEIDAAEALVPGTQVPVASIPQSERERALAAKLTVLEPEQVVANHVKQALRQHAARLFGVQEMAKIVESLRKTHRELVNAVTPEDYSMPKLTTIFSELLEQQISIRDARGIFETLARVGPIDDLEELTRLIRYDLRFAMRRRFETRGRLGYYQLSGTAIAAIDAAGADPQARWEVRSAIQKSLSRTIQRHLHLGHPPVAIVQNWAQRAVLLEAAKAEFPGLVVFTADECPPGHLDVSRGIIELEDHLAPASA